jgi:hypothetical protein
MQQPPMRGYSEENEKPKRPASSTGTQERRRGTKVGAGDDAQTLDFMQPIADT